MNYTEWNKRLTEHFFNTNRVNQEVEYFLVYKELFDEILGESNGLEDFESAIKSEIASGSSSDKGFINRLLKLYTSGPAGSPIMIQGRRLVSPLPKYFGLVIYLIYALTESEGSDLKANAVYDRINEKGKTVFESSWIDLNTSVGRKLEDIWKDLENWTFKMKNKELGFFLMRDPKSASRKYVSRLERHALLNSSDFRKIFDALIIENVIPGSILSIDKWIQTFSKHQDKIRNAKLILDFLKEDSDLTKPILNFINQFTSEKFTSEYISLNETKVRTPAIPLLLTFRGFPGPFDPQEINFSMFGCRAFSFELEEDTIANTDIIIKPDKLGYSLPIDIDWDNPDWDFNKIYKGEIQRYTFNHSFHWFVRNNALANWTELRKPQNSKEFALLVKAEIKNEIANQYPDFFQTLETPWNDWYMMNLKSIVELSPEQFQKICKILGLSVSIEGQIELISSFYDHGKRDLYQEFDNIFKYNGPIASPNLVVDLEEECQLINEGEEGYFTLPKEIDLNLNFKIKETKSGLTTFSNFRFNTLPQYSDNLDTPSLKDEDGMGLDQQITGEDILDIPQKFNRNTSCSDFQGFQMKTALNGISNYSIFKPLTYGPPTRKDLDTSYDPIHQGECFLRYLASKEGITTRDFPKLIRELSPEISEGYSKVLLEYFRHLGYINFKTYGEEIKVSPPSIVFLSTQNGLRGYLSGYRNNELIEKLTKYCNSNDLTLKFRGHSKKMEKHSFMPYRIEIYNKDGKDLVKFMDLAETVGISFVNNIKNSANVNYANYQLACFYMQRSIKEFKDYIISLPETGQDFPRKSIFNTSSLRWSESNMEIADIPDNTLIKYDGFVDRQVDYVYKLAGKTYKLQDFTLSVFHSLSIHDKNVFLKRPDDDQSISDLYVPLRIKLPFWIERGLLLMNAAIPEVTNDGKYRYYENISNDIIEMIESKLGQTSKTIKTYES